MIEWFKARLAERSTYAGIAAVVACIGLFSLALFKPDAYGNFKDAMLTVEAMLFAGGIGGVIWKERK